MDQKLELAVLCVDDEPEIVGAMSHNLRRSVERVVTAEDGQEALEILEREAIDAVITDIRMPRMDGLELLRAIRERYGDLPVVILSAFNDESYLLEAIELGARKYLHKPINLTMLRAVLEDIAQVVSLRREMAEAQQLLEEYRAALDRTALVSRADEAGYIRYVNDNFIKISGYSREELIGQRYDILQPHGEEMAAAIMEQLRSNQSWHGVFKNRRKSGEIYFVESTIVPLEDAQGNPEYLSIDYEVTEREVQQHEKQARLIRMRSEQHRQHLQTVGVLQKELAEKSATIRELTRALVHQKAQTARYIKALEQADDHLRHAEDQILKLQGQIETLTMNHKGVLGKIASLEDRNRQLTRMMEARRR